MLEDVIIIAPINSPIVEQGLGSLCDPMGSKEIVYACWVIVAVEQSGRAVRDLLLLLAGIDDV